jgi:GGDEF domain-containing protein
MKNVHDICRMVKEPLQVSWLIFSEPFMIDEKEYCFIASIGVSFFTDHGANLDELLAHADAKMYAAKDTVNSSFTIFEKKG